ncbi:hypothetical protein [Hahella ganghwensis]|uniref:hypothetical protein n=1 Tax=Hahella ganghwensis TaxID=286420 RepID=UPI0004767798|nr:hypothetical protein [Hahella ganghwensis]
MKSTNILVSQIATTVIAVVAIISAYLFGLYLPFNLLATLASLTIFTVLLTVFPTLWMILLPFFCLVVNLAPETGRFIFNELDLAFLVVVGGVGLHMGLIRKWVPAFPGWTILAFLALALVPITQVPFSELLEPSLGNPYYSPAYFYQVAKGIVLAFVLALFTREELNHNRQRTLKALVAGAWLASVAIFVIVLWERGSLGVMATTTDLYKIGNSLLNLSTTYRVTGLLADMHTGGESLDGWFLLLIPLNMLGVMVFRSQKARLASIVCLGMVFYCVVMGFTRATYASAAISVAVFIVLSLYKSRRENQGRLAHMSLIELVLLGAFAICTWVAYSVSGFYVLIAAALLLFGGLVLAMYRERLNGFFWPALAVIACLAAVINFDSLSDSRWVDDSMANRLKLAGVTLGLVVAAVYIYGFRKITNTKLYLYSNIFTLMIALALCLALGGSRIQSRMETVENDWQTRLKHWSNVIASSEWRLSDHLIGNGLGSFTANYLTYNPDLVREVGSFSVLSDDQGSAILAVGPEGDQMVGQRVSIRRGQTYRVEMVARANDKLEVRFTFCERNLIIFDRWDVKCTGRNFPVRASENFEKYQLEIKSKKVGRESITQLPTLFIVKPRKGDSILEIQSIRVTDADGRNLISNGDFEQGMDNWFFYHDFKHLPWHIKNIYLSLYYQLGSIGVVLFAVMTGVLIRRNLRPSEDSHLITAITAIVASYLAFGMFGDPLDSPRVNWLFYALLFFACARNRTSTRRVVGSVGARAA